MNTYPSKQPFPRQRAVSIDASSGPTSPALAGLRTYKLPPYEDALQTLHSFLEHYGDVNNGAALGIKGSFGSGKTHLIQFLISEARTFHPETIQAYAKAKSGDLFEVYKDLINRLGMRQLAEGHVKVLSAAGRRLSEGNELLDATVNRLREKPEIVLNLIRDTLLSESDIVEDAANALRGEGSRFTDFFSVFTFLNDTRLQATAFSWFQGEKLDREKLERLGVSSPLAETDAGRGLQFLSMMYSFAGAPLILYIDQIERLILDEPDRSAGNRGHLHSLVEAFVANGNMLVLAGVSEAWDKLPEDFIQRLTPPIVTLPSLNVKQTQAIIAVYLSSDSERYGFSDIFPFTEESIVTIVQISRGNIRSIIGLCYRCFEIAFPGKRAISAETVTKAAESLQQLYNRTTVLDEICMLLRAAKCRYERKVLLAHETQDIVVPNSTEPRAIINVMEPVFLEDEARDAHRHAAAAEKLRAIFPNVESVLVDIGYRSPEVERQLTPPLIDWYVRYDPERFRGEFKGIIEAIQNPIEDRDTSRGANETTAVNESIRELRELVLSRKDEEARVDERIAQIMRSIAPVVTAQNKVEGGIAQSSLPLAVVGAMSILVTLGFFGILAILILRGMAQGEQVAQIINIVIGVLAAAFVGVVIYWLGFGGGRR
jgi:Cdc6-like AAA superfamily ATPase